MHEPPKYLDYHSKPLDLRDEGRRFPRHHVFRDEDVDAINAALAAGRPLLLRGRPGTGKSQLALAAALALGRAFVSEVVDARTESRDLLYRFDAVRRLADAQVQSPERFEARRQRLEVEDHGDLLHESFYTSPGPLWWAFDWRGATRQAAKAQVSPPKLRAGCDPSNGVVVLLDEIDKADSSLPNGLLGVLGEGEFKVPGVKEVVCGETEPLVVITTNEERALPDAFLRRCAVHRLDLDPKAFRDWLIRLGAAHFPGFESSEEEDGILGLAADLVCKDRDQCLEEQVNPPGSAEYLDLLRVVSARSEGSATAARKHLETAQRFLLRKHWVEEFS